MQLIPSWSRIMESGQAQDIRGACVDKEENREGEELGSSGRGLGKHKWEHRPFSGVQWFSLSG